MNFTPYNAAKCMRWNDRILKILDGEIPDPVTLTIDPTNLCPHNCVWCFVTDYREKYKNSLNEDDFKHILEILKNYDIKGVEFTGGGEPLSNPLTLKYMPKIKNHAKIGLVTNGSLLNERAGRTIVDNCQWMRVSLDAGKPSTHKKLHRCHRSDFKRTIDNLKKMNEYAKSKGADFYFGVAFLIHPENYVEIPEATELVKKTGARYINFRPVWTDYTGVSDGIGFESNNFFKHCGNEIRMLIDYAEKHYSDDKFSVYGTFDRVQWTSQADFYDKCRATPFNPAIGADGTVWLCCERRGELPLGNIRVTPFDKLWGSKKHERLINSINLHECPAKCKYSIYNQIIKRWYIDNEAGWEHL